MFSTDEVIKIGDITFGRKYEDAFEQYRYTIHGPDDLRIDLMTHRKYHKMRLVVGTHEVMRFVASFMGSTIMMSEVGRTYRYKRGENGLEMMFEGSTSTIVLPEGRIYKQEHICIGRYIIALLPLITDYILDMNLAFCSGFNMMLSHNGDMLFEVEGTKIEYRLGHGLIVRR
jgi:hypothetical protein